MTKALTLIHESFKQTRFNIHFKPKTAAQDDHLMLVYFKTSASVMCCDRDLNLQLVT